MNSSATTSGVYALAGSIVFLGTLMGGMAFPFLAKRVSPNSTFGFRTAKTLSNPETWYTANIFMAKAMLITAFIMIVLGTLLILWCRAGKFSNLLLSRIGLVFEVVPLVLLLIGLYIYHRTL
ncbi:SdpI family protein [Deinococcus sp. 6YEL10]|uniref:SdpI family protein n=1 Tax=unclassified Deinococcus TaxID=2623546 RepID=UPI00351CEC15|nr:SdpI family protein [Deinococcus sp. 6GRE01]MCD0160217.1 SdpI family protein [Deinococcus sp. 6YEL10]